MFWKLIRLEEEEERKKKKQGDKETESLSLFLISIAIEGKRRVLSLRSLTDIPLCLQKTLGEPLLLLGKGGKYQ